MHRLPIVLALFCGVLWAGTAADAQTSEIDRAIATNPGLAAIIGADPAREAQIRERLHRAHALGPEALEQEALKIGREFAGHGSVNHNAEEYVRGTFWYTNTVESYFALLKRGMMGAFHNVSEAHLFRYLAEFDFRHNTRKISDAERAEELLRGAKGKRLMYQQPRETTNA